ncbi:MAG: hypothetical protein IJK87_11010 [Prevotella sp.]|nr:hypothetical protein [Prevotella sp.]
MKKTTLIIALAFCCATQMMAQLNGTGYYRLRNAANDTHYVNFANHIFNYTTIISTAGGGLSQFLWSYNAAVARALECAGLYLQTDIHLVEDENCTNPSTAIYLYKSSGSKYDLQGEGTSLIALTTGQYPGTTRFDFQNVYATISRASGSGANTLYVASIQLKDDSGTADLGTRYFVDNNGTFAISDGYSANNAKWYIEPITSLHVDPKVAHGGKYYTTMYVPFAYKLGGTVENAYVVSNVDIPNAQVTITPIASTGGTVPAGTPVVLECSSNTPSDNQLIPSGDPLVCAYSVDNTAAPAPTYQTNYEGTNLLAGTYYCNTDGKLTFTKKSGTGSFNANDVTNNTNSTMRVLGVVNGKIGFFKLASSVKYMAANKAWLDISDLPASAKNMSRFSIVINGIEDNNDSEGQLVSEDGGFPDSIEGVEMNGRKNVVYDLQGRRVSMENLTKGIYIVNGKKVFIQ